MIRKLAILLSIFISSWTMSQSLERKYQDSEVGFKEFSSTYEYYWDETEEKIRVKQTDEVELIALKTNVSFTWPIFYNDQIELSDIDLRNKYGRKYRGQKICGHVEQSGIFYSDAKVCTYTVDFNVKNESVKLTSERIYKDPRYFTKVNLPFILPGQTRKVKVIWPDWIDVELLTFHFEGQNIEVTDLDIQGKKGIEYTWEWPSKLENEERTPSTSFYSPHLIALTKAFSHPANGERIELINDLDGLYSWYKILVSNVNNNNESLESTVSKLVEGKNPEDQIKSIYYWVQDNIKYIAFEDGIMGFQPEDAHIVFEKKYGDCKGMANLLKAMLKIAGFDARLSWLGTNHLPYSYEIPSLIVDNHMICSVIQDGNAIYLDATAKYAPLNYTPGHIQGKEILIEDGEGYFINKIPIASSDQNLEMINLEMTVLNGKLVSIGKLNLTGDSQQLFLYLYNNLPNSTKERFVMSYVSQSGSSQDFRYKLNMLSRDSTIVIDIFNESDHLLNEFGDEMYVQMDLRNELSEDKIASNRKSPFAFQNRRHIQSVTYLEIPEGYEVSYLPDPLTINTSNYAFSLSYQLIDGKVMYEKKLDIKDLIIRPDLFESWNQAIEQLNEFYESPIVLTYAEN
ncbi:transglutaminase-like domain-containing protein [Ekhidna sp.]